MKQTKQAFTHFFYSASNSIHENQKNESGWLNLVQYGNYPHEKGIQIFNTESAKVLINHFKSLKARLLRAFGGIPIFIGHPDDSSFNNQSGHQDTRAYAWIIDMKQDDKGLWILPRWSQAGKEILENAFYKFLSPRWLMKSIENGAFAPIELISVGLTNTPNIPGNAIANAHNNQEHPTNTLMTDSEPTVNQIKQLKDENQRLSQSIKDFDEQNQLLKNQNYALETSLSNAQLAYDKGKKEKIHMLLSLKTKEGLIHSNEYTYWANALENNFDEALNNLSKKTQILNTRCQTLNLKQNATLANSKNRLIALVNERIHQTGEAYSIAWSKIKQKHTELSL